MSMEFTEIAKGMSYLTDKGAFLTAKGLNEVNTMTISWGFIGVFWGKPYFIAAVRPTRFTKTLLDEGGSFTISIPWGCMVNELDVCGTASGRDIDKSKVVSFKASKQVDAPVVAGCQTYFECIIKYSDALNQNKIPVEIAQSLYKDDFHTLYFGEIIAVYEEPAMP